MRLTSSGIASPPANLASSHERFAFSSASQWVEQFLASMPEHYKQLFGRESICSHARVAQARGDDVLHLDYLPNSSDDESELCVVALSSPGLLAAISTALMREGLDVVRADVYAHRTGAGDDETIALFCLRTMSGRSCEALDAVHLPRLKTRLIELLRSRELAPRLQEPAYTNHLQRGDTIACFRSVRGTRRTTIELHCRYRPGILAAVTTALSQQGVLIVDARARSNGSRIHEYFEIEEPSGSPPSYPRLIHLLTLVVDAASEASVGRPCTLGRDREPALVHTSTAVYCFASPGAQNWTSTSESSSCER